MKKLLRKSKKKHISEVKLVIFLISSSFVFCVPSFVLVFFQVHILEND